MRHRNHKFQLGRKKEHREALMANLAAALFTHGRIRTTLAKARALRPFSEKIVTLAKEARSASPERALYLRRLAIARVRDRAAVRLLFDERAEEFANRPGGYTRIYKLADRRIGDAAEMALIELIPAADEGHRKPRRKSSKAARPVPAAASAGVDEEPTATGEADPPESPDETVSGQSAAESSDARKAAE